jgi:hypothetical protein
LPVIRPDSLRVRKIDIYKASARVAGLAARSARNQTQPPQIVIERIIVLTTLRKRLAQGPVTAQEPSDNRLMWWGSRYGVPWAVTNGAWHRLICDLRVPKSNYVMASVPG